MSESQWGKVFLTASPRWMWEQEGVVNMNESGWLTSESPAAMLRHLVYHSIYDLHPETMQFGVPREKPLISERKARLWVEAMRNVEERASGETGDWYELKSRVDIFGAADAWCLPNDFIPQADKARLLREIVGNPFRPIEVVKVCDRCESTDESLIKVIKGVQLCSRCMKTRGSDCGVFKQKRIEDFAWINDPAVQRVAKSIHGNGTYEDMPILGDALEEAGCTDEGILGHCRADKAHVRGCWVVDLILGME